MGSSVGALFLDAADPILLDDVADSSYISGRELEEADAVGSVEGYGSKAGFEGGFDVGWRIGFDFCRDSGFGGHPGFRMVMERFIGNHGI